MSVSPDLLAEEGLLDDYQKSSYLVGIQEGRAGAT